MPLDADGHCAQGWDGIVVHVAPGGAGGVGRFIRHIAYGRPFDRCVHTAEGAWHLQLFRPRFWVSMDQPGRAAAQTVLQDARLIHAHSTVEAVRAAVFALAGVQSVPYGVTLHDTGFVGDGLPEAERDARRRFLSQAAFVTAPSSYLMRLAEETSPGLRCVHLPNGSPTLEPQPWPGEAPPGRFDIMVIGAIGEHKGLQRLKQTAALLPESVRIVVAGYVDGQINRGWYVPGKIWLTGPFEPEHLPALVSMTGARLAFFPNVQPEGFCYALSDAWQCGLFAFAPDDGALGERVRAAGAAAGMVYPASAPPSEVATGLLTTLRADDVVPRDTARHVPSLDSTLSALDALYAAHGPRACPAVVPPERVTVSTLDDRLFREELRHLLAVNDRHKTEIGALNALSLARGAEIERLERVIQEVRLQAQEHEAHLLRDLETIRLELDETRAAHALHSTKLERDIDELRSAAHLYRQAIELVPKPLRSWLIGRAQKKLND